MIVRSVAAFAALACAGLVPPALAQSIDPALVLAAKEPMKGPTKGSVKSHLKPGQGFAGRTARLTSIMGPEVGTVAPLHVPNTPVRSKAMHREADASAGLR